MLITEDFLHYLWKFRLFDHRDLQTTAGDEMEIFSAGLHNTHAGPDFQNSRIRIGDTTWAGNVEIHINASDWNKHNHTADGAYNNVILHIVYYNDAEITLPDGRILPTFELKHRIPDDLYGRYHQLIYGEKTIIPCEASIGKVDDFTLRTWLTRVLTERLQKKSEIVIHTLQVNNGDWEETFYQFLAANFGFKINALPFELMARSLPQKILAKHKNSPQQIEAMIFGQAGMLEGDFEDEYPQQLKQEYIFLRTKYNLAPLEKHLWKYMRLRPPNFPSVRLAQFAALIVNSNHLFSKVLDIKQVSDLRKLFTGINVNDYWGDRYRFDKPAAPSAKNMGETSVNILLLNTFALFLFSYGKYNQQQHYIDRSLKLLEELPAERNSIIDDFNALGVKAGTAFETQALLELRNYYCNFKQCLQCSIGNKILKLS